MTLWIAGITNGADLLSYLILLHLLWPSRSILYLLKGEEPIPYDLLITGKICCKKEVCFVMLFNVMSHSEESYVGRMKFVLSCLFC